VKAENPTVAHGARELSRTYGPTASVHEGAEGTNPASATSCGCEVKLLTCAATTRTWGHGSAIVPQSIRKQATDLRYIFEAPKLKIGDDERVSIPDLSDADALAYALTHKKTLTPSLAPSSSVVAGLLFLPTNSSSVFLPERVPHNSALFPGGARGQRARKLCPALHRLPT